MAVGLRAHAGVTTYGLVPFPAAAGEPPVLLLPPPALPPVLPGAFCGFGGPVVAFGSLAAGERGDFSLAGVLGVVAGPRGALDGVCAGVVEWLPATRRVSGALYRAFCSSWLKVSGFGGVIGAACGPGAGSDAEGEICISLAGR